MIYLIEHEYTDGARAINEAPTRGNRIMSFREVVEAVAQADDGVVRVVAIDWGDLDHKGVVYAEDVSEPVAKAVWEIGDDLVNGAGRAFAARVLGIDRDAMPDGFDPREHRLTARDVGVGRWR